MKKFLKLLSIILVFSLAGCFNIANETSINEDGSGVYTNTMDLGSMFSMIKMMGGSEANEISQLKLDTLFSLASLKDSIPNLTEKEKLQLEKATSKMQIDGSDEKMIMSFIFPYTISSELNEISALIRKIRSKTVSSQLSKFLPDEGAGDESTPEDANSLYPDDYFDYSQENGKISKKINKERYATAQEDKGLKSLLEMSQMGSPMTLTTVLNLPRPAIKVTGSNVKLSEDKKRVTIESDIDDFFEHPEKMEYELEF